MREERDGVAKFRAGFLSRGGVLANGAKAKEISGTVIDGCCCDLDDCIDTYNAVYARGTVVQTARGRAIEESTNQMIQFGGVQVRPGDFLDDVKPGQIVVIDNAGWDTCTVRGDIILGDDTGVLVVPQSRAEEVVEIVEKIDCKEQEILKLIAEGHSLKEAKALTGYHHLQTKGADTDAPVDYSSTFATAP